MTDPFDFGEDWKSEEEKHEHCVLTENVCRWIARAPHGHPGGCCTCDLDELPVFLSYGYRTDDQWRDSERRRLQAKRSLLAWRVEEAIREGWDEGEESGHPSQGEFINRDEPSIPRALGDARQLESMPSRPPQSIYEQIKRDSQEPPRIVTTAYPVNKGRIIIAHKFDDNGRGECNRCEMPRVNRIHQRAEKEIPPVLRALIDAVSHTCDQLCLDKGCWFNYRASVNKVRRILNEVSK